jgi:transcription initiation factor TFIIIB Brf1 subunit/transcription initiation factor TFIIB
LQHECKFIHDAETLENVCFLCGCVEGTQIDEKFEKENTIALMSFELTAENNDFASTTVYRTEDMIIPRKTHIDFSNGGFLSTKIDARNVDAQGKRTNSSYTNKLKYNQNFMLSASNPPTLKNSIWKISAYGDKMNLPPPVQELAAEIFQKMYDAKANIHNSSNMVCACLYYACKVHGLNKKIEDIATMVSDEATVIKQVKKSVFSCYEKLMETLDLKIPKHFSIPDDIVYVGNRIGLPEATIRYAVNMYHDVRARDRIFFSGKSNRLTATILLYISAMIHNDFIRSDKLELDHFIHIVKGSGISLYILQKRANDYLHHPFFADHNVKVQERKIIL